MVSVNCGITGRNSDEAFTEKSLRRHLLDAKFVNTSVTSGKGWKIQHNYFACEYIILNFIFWVFFSLELLYPSVSHTNIFYFPDRSTENQNPFI